MDDAAKVALQQVFRVLTEIGHPATNGAVFAIVRGAKIRFRNNEGKTLLAALRADPGPAGVQFGRTQGPPEVQAGPPSRKRTRSKELSKIVPYVQDSFPLTNVNGRASDKPSPSSDLEWVTTLRGRYQALFDRQVVELRETGRLTVARYCALEFGKCRRDENVNRRKAKSCLSSLGNLIDVLRRNGAPFSVAQFDRLARRYHAEIGGGPWYTPCDIKALLVVVQR